MDRMDRFKKLCDYYLGGVPPDGGPYDSTADEDAAGFIYDSENHELKQFCLVTAGAEYVYLYPQANTLGDVVRDLIPNKIDPGTYSEAPVAVVDLDTGEEWAPDWNSLSFTRGVDG